MASSVDAKLLKSTKFPPEFGQKVDMQKVNVEVMKKWIAGKISEILGNEDDVVIELCFNLLEGSRFPDIKVLQIQLTGFLDKDTAKFCKELWLLCLSARSNPQGVPKELLEAKKLELIQEKIDQEKAAEEAQRRKEQEKLRDKNIDSIRQRERGERGGRGRGSGDRGTYDPGRHPRRFSRSPPARRRSPPSRDDYRPAPRAVDTYIPFGRRTGREDDRPRRSPPPTRSESISSRSRTPPRRRYPDDSPPPRRRRHTVSRSRSPPRRGPGKDRARGGPKRSDDRARSYTHPETSRSRSRRRSRKRRTPSLPSRSPSPPLRSRYRRRRRSSASSLPSRSRSLSRNRQRGGRPRRSLSYDSDYRRDDTRADYRKGRHNPHHGRRRPSPSLSRDRLSPAPFSKSPSPDRHRDRKRRRSIQRYEPAGRRRRNTSSVSTPVDKRRKMADSSADEGTPLPKAESVSRAEEPSATADANDEKLSLTLTATELRERLLRERLKAQQKSRNSGKEPQRNPTSNKSP